MREQRGPGRSGPVQVRQPPEDPALPQQLRAHHQEHAVPQHEALQVK